MSSNCCRCQFDIKVRWSRSVGHTPFAGAPLITDINGDGQMDIVAATFSDEVMVLQGNDGHPLPNARWPFQLVDTAVYASPILVGISFCIKFVMECTFIFPKFSLQQTIRLKNTYIKHVYI